jgi:hypothetical protein
MKDNQPVFVASVESQHCTPGNALLQYELSTLLRSGFNDVLNQLESEGRHEEVSAIRRYVARVVWWAQEEQIASAKARGFARDIATGYDHEEDAHKHKDGSCRVCNAEKLLA